MYYSGKGLLIYIVTAKEILGRAPPIYQGIYRQDHAEKQEYNILCSGQI